MKQIATTGIVLNRVDYAEADRILTWLTPDNGKISLIAKGVRREKSKLAGGIELFSESNVSFIKGRGEVGTLTSSRLIRHFENIVKELPRVNAGFEFIKIINRTTEDEAGGEWYRLLKYALEGLNDQTLDLEIVELWFNLHLLKISGHSPNLQTDLKKQPLKAAAKFAFSFDDMTFFESTNGPFKAEHIKLLRLGISVARPKALAYVQKTKKLLPELVRLSKTMLGQFVRI